MHERSCVVAQAGRVGVPQFIGVKARYNRAHDTSGTTGRFSLPRRRSILPVGKRQALLPLIGNGIPPLRSDARSGIYQLRTTTVSAPRVPAVYLTWANPVFLAFFSFSRMSKLSYLGSGGSEFRFPPPTPWNPARVWLECRNLLNPRRHAGIHMRVAI